MLEKQSSKRLAAAFLSLALAVGGRYGFKECGENKCGHFSGTGKGVSALTVMLGLGAAVPLLGSAREAMNREEEEQRKRKPASRPDLTLG